MICCRESFRRLNLLGLCRYKLLFRIQYLILHLFIWVLTKHHALKHALQFNSTFPLINHLLVHALVVVYIFPAFFLCTEVELFCLRLWLLSLALTLIRPSLITYCSTTTSVTITCLSTTLATTSVLDLSIILHLNAVFLFNGIAELIGNASFLCRYILNHNSDFILPLFYQFVDF